jgi:hypothetical protein
LQGFAFFMRYRLALICLPMLLVGCASTDFIPFSDGGRVYVGQGGAVEVVKGVEIWSDGAPARPYRVLGIVLDQRPKAVIPMASFKGDVASAVRSHRGDAAILISRDYDQLGSIVVPGQSQTTFRGTVTPSGNAMQVAGTATTTRYPSTVIQRVDQISKIAVIKYEPAAALPPVP